MYFAVVPIFYVKVLFIAINWRVRWYFTFLLVTSLSQFRRQGWLQRSKSWDAPVSEESGVSMLVFGGHGWLMCVCDCSQYRCIHHTQITLNNYANANWRASSRKDIHIYGTIFDGWRQRKYILQSASNKDRVINYCSPPISWWRFEDIKFTCSLLKNRISDCCQVQSNWIHLIVIHGPLVFKHPS